MIRPMPAFDEWKAAAERGDTEAMKRWADPAAKECSDMICDNLTTSEQMEVLEYMVALVGESEESEAVRRTLQEKMRRGL